MLTTGYLVTTPSKKLSSLRESLREMEEERKLLRREGKYHVASDTLVYVLLNGNTDIRNISVFRCITFECNGFTNNHWVFDRITIYTRDGSINAFKEYRFSDLHDLKLVNLKNVTQSRIPGVYLAETSAKTK